MRMRYWSSALCSSDLLNWLDSEWNQFRNIAAKEGVEVGYHVLVNTAARAGEPDLYLVTINKDFLKTAEGLALEKKVNAAMQTNRKQFETESAGRAPMRKVLSTIELQELKLKSRLIEPLGSPAPHAFGAVTSLLCPGLST